MEEDRRGDSIGFAGNWAHSMLEKWEFTGTTIDNDDIECSGMVSVTKKIEDAKIFWIKRSD